MESLNIKEAWINMACHMSEEALSRISYSRTLDSYMILSRISVDREYHTLAPTTILSDLPSLSYLDHPSQFLILLTRIT